MSSKQEKISTSIFIYQCHLFDKVLGDAANKE
jgi:hypothetical protein